MDQKFISSISVMMYFDHFKVSVSFSNLHVYYLVLIIALRSEFLTPFYR